MTKKHLDCHNKIKGDETCEICLEGYYSQNMHTSKVMPIKPFTPLYISGIISGKNGFSCSYGTTYEEIEQVKNRIKKLNFIFGG
jgi:hypothetical protein